MRHRVVGLMLAVATTMFTLGATWITCLDIGGTHVGVVSAAMNTAGPIGSVFGPPVVIHLLRQFNDWNAPVIGMGILFLRSRPAYCRLPATLVSPSPMAAAHAVSPPCLPSP